MEENSAAGGMHFENSFNGANQNAVGPDARVDMGSTREPRKKAPSPEKAAPWSGPISFNTSFNNATANAVGPGAQVHSSPGPSETSGLFTSYTLSENEPARAAEAPSASHASASQVILLYSQEDRVWAERVKKHLAFLQQRYGLEVWDERQIAPGERWREALISALAGARIALLLVSASFLASGVLARNELMLLRQRLEAGQLKLLPLILSPCMYEESLLGAYQPFHFDQPLTLLQPAQQEALLVYVAREIYKALQ